MSHVPAVRHWPAASVLLWTDTAVGKLKGLERVEAAVTGRATLAPVAGSVVTRVTSRVVPTQAEVALQGTGREAPRV